MGDDFTKAVIRFQSTLPRGERLYCHRTTDPASDFNPRSREGSDLNSNTWDHFSQISIRAPARGATAPTESATIKALDKFQSTLPRGERHPLYSSLFHNKYFNPRSREGSDKDR